MVMRALKQNTDDRISITPKVLMLSGIPGAGKTTLAGNVAKLLGAGIVSKDWICHHMFPFYEATEDEYWMSVDATLNAVLLNVKMGRNVIFDGMTFRHDGLIEYVKTRVKCNGGEAAAAYLDCPPEIAAERISNDAHHPARDRNPQLPFKKLKAFRVFPSNIPTIDARLKIWEVTIHLINILINWGWVPDESANYYKRNMNASWKIPGQ